SGVARKVPRRGGPDAAFGLEALTAGRGSGAFPPTFEEVAGLMAADRIVLVRGRADLRGRELQLVAREITEPVVSGVPEAPAAPPRPSDPSVADLPAEPCTDGLLGRLKELLVLHPGPVPVIVRLADEGAVT